MTSVIRGKPPCMSHLFPHPCFRMSLMAAYQIHRPSHRQLPLLCFAREGSAPPPLLHTARTYPLPSWVLPLVVLLSGFKAALTPADFASQGPGSFALINACECPGPLLSTCGVSGATTPPALLSARPSSVVGSSLQGMFDCILLSLQEASWPSHSRRSDVISGTSPSSGYFNFGVQLSRRSCLTQVTRELPEMCRDLSFPLSFPHRTMEHHLCLTGLPQPSTFRYCEPAGLSEPFAVAWLLHGRPPLA